MTVHTFNPIHDPRWPAFVANHRRASVFHTRAWLEALRRTYAYEPIVYSTCPPDAALTNGIVLCRVTSWLTGSRLVSVPFADHCEPLVDTVQERTDIVAALQETVRTQTLKYAEIRVEGSDFADGSGLAKETSYCLHALDLRPALDDLHKAIHKNAIRVQIRRAEREALRQEAGNSEALLDQFYGLLVVTRRRHRLPPQPIHWFRNLIACLGDLLEIRVASKDGRPIAGILTLRSRNALVYKYCCSDARFHHLGPVPFLLWQAIKEAKDRGLETLDMGRTDADNIGLMTFKERWGATPSTLTYWRCAPRGSRAGSQRFGTRLATRLFGYLPDDVLIAAGKLLYRHIA